MDDTGSTGQDGSSTFFAQLSAEEQQCFDEPGLLKRVRGKEHRAQKLVSGFIENFAGYQADLTAAIQLQDCAATQLHSHSIKGAAANLGANKLSAIAAAMEQLAKNSQDSQQQSFQQIRDQLPELDSAFQSFKTLAQRRFGI